MRRREAAKRDKYKKQRYRSIELQRLNGDKSKK